MAYRNGLTVAGQLLLHQTYNPSASHPLSTSPYTGEASPAGDEGSPSEGAKGAGMEPAGRLFYLGRRSSEKAEACSGGVGEVSI